MSIKPEVVEYAAEVMQKGFTIEYLASAAGVDPKELQTAIDDYYDDTPNE